jgi:tRNA delta(2)-isopentenylpyrophosphate transferase
MANFDLITILGPTASGKTPFAAALANELDTEIISADSRQIYKQMDLGTGKDLADYTVNGKQIPYHLIDVGRSWV